MSLRSRFKEPRAASLKWRNGVVGATSPGGSILLALAREILRRRSSLSAGMRVRAGLDARL